MLPIPSRVLNWLNATASRIETLASSVQGRGGGASSVNSEVRSVLKLFEQAPKPLLAIDMGANVGDYSAQLLASCPSLELHLFEPAAVNIEKLRKRFEIVTNVHIVPCAVAGADGLADLWADSPGSSLGSLTRRRLDHFNVNLSMRESVRTLRFESYWRNILECRAVDIVKMDIEGYEYSALHGFGEAISHVNVLQFEFGGCNIDTRTYFQDFWYLLSGSDFVIYRVTPFGLVKISHYSERDEYFLTTNYVCVRRGFLS